MTNEFHVVKQLADIPDLEVMLLQRQFF